MPQAKMLDTFKAGQVTDQPPFKLSAIGFQRLQNVFTSPEGIKPIHALCDAVGPTINALSYNSVGFPVFVYKGVGYAVANQGTGSIALYKLNNDFISDHQTSLESLTYLDGQVSTTAWNTLTASEQLAYLLKNRIKVYGENLLYRGDLSQDYTGKLIDSVAYRYWDMTTSAGDVVQDIDGSVENLGPEPKKFLVHSEYLLAIGGYDGFDHDDTTTSANAAAGAVSISCTDVSKMSNGEHFGIQLDDGTWYWTTISNIVGSTVTIALGLPSTAASGNLVRTSVSKNTEHDNYFRYNYPTFLDRWHPSPLVPPDSLAGYKEWMGGTPFSDAFIWNNVVFASVNNLLQVFVKVGGETGYTMQQKDIPMKIADGAIDSIVGTSKAAYVLAMDGLYLFDGLSLSPVSAGTTNRFFDKLWFRKNISDTIFTEGGRIQSIQVGMHYSILNTIAWFVTYGSAGNEANMILLYNYETNSASYLLPPSTEIWHPLYGDIQGIAVYTKFGGSTKCFAFREKTTDTSPPDAELDIDTGFIFGQEAVEDNTLDNIYFGSEPELSSDILSGLAIHLKSLDEKNVVHQDFDSGKVVGDGYTRGFINVRASGRYISIRLKGSPNSWTDYTQGLNGSLSLLSWIGIEATPEGSRR